MQNNHFVIVACLISCLVQIINCQPCICKGCDLTKTVGEVYNRKCYFIQDNFAKFTNRHLVSVNPISNKESLQVFHNVTQRFFKKFSKNLITFNLTSRYNIANYLRLPSYPVRQLRCPVYDISTNIFYDEYNSCLKRPQYAISSEYRVVSDATYDLRSCKRNVLCYRIKNSNKECKVVTVENRGDYKLLEQYVMYHKSELDGFLIEFDQNQVQLFANDSFMHVSFYNKYKNPFSSHFVDMKSGKIFQLLDDDISKVLWHEEKKKLCYKYKKALCSLYEPC